MRMVVKKLRIRSQLFDKYAEVLEAFGRDHYRLKQVNVEAKVRVDVDSPAAKRLELFIESQVRLIADRRISRFVPISDFFICLLVIVILHEEPAKQAHDLDCKLTIYFFFGEVDKLLVCDN
jgi:hypothetical protein